MKAVIRLLVLLRVTETGQI